MPATKYRTKLTAGGGAAIDEIFKSNADLSACQYHFVALGTVAGEIVGAIGASNPVPIGILQNAPAASQNAIVRMFGRSQISAFPATCNLYHGELITSSGCGNATQATPCGGVALARWLSASLASATSATCTVFIGGVLPSASLGSAS